MSSSLLRIGVKYILLESAGGGTPVNGNAESPAGWSYNMTSKQLQRLVSVSASSCCVLTDALTARSLWEQTSWWRQYVTEE